MHCVKCGYNNPNNEKFCNNCGYQLLPDSMDVDAGNRTNRKHYQAKKDGEPAWIKIVKICKVVPLVIGGIVFAVFREIWTAFVLLSLFGISLSCMSVDSAFDYHVSVKNGKPYGKDLYAAIVWGVCAFMPFILMIMLANYLRNHSISIFS